MNFLKKLHSSSKLRSLKKKRFKLDSQRKKLAKLYKSMVKSESKRLSKTNKKNTSKAKSHKRVK